MLFQNFLKQILKNYHYPQIDGNADNDDNADSHEKLVCP